MAKATSNKTTNTMANSFALVDSGSRILEISSDKDELCERSGHDREVVSLVESHTVGDVIDYTDRGVEIPGYDCLYDSEDNSYLTADALGITPEQYATACRESATAICAEGHIEVSGRRVYASF